MNRSLLGGFFILLLTVLGLAACAAGAPPTEDGGLPTAPPEATGEVEYEYGTADVDEVEVMLLESFPVQVRAIARGNLPNGCAEIDEQHVTRSGDTFDVELTTRTLTNAMCTEALVAFEEAIPLEAEGLPAGTYTVDVNGVTATFTLDVDNTLTSEDSAG